MAEGLRPSGAYYEGFVDDATAIFEKYEEGTLTTFGTGTSKSSHPQLKASDKENAVSSRWMA